jgi:probable phosphoglycerate mutase
VLDEGIELVLARHGRTAWNRMNRHSGWSEVGLDRTGRREAAVLARRLKALRIDALYSSDLPRALQTAAEVSAVLGLSIQTTPLLRERRGGVLEGLTLEEARREAPDALWDESWTLSRRKAFRAAGAESFDDLAGRAHQFLAGIKHDRHGQNVVVVCHEGTIRALLYALGLLTDADLFAFSLPNGSALRVTWYDHGATLYAKEAK